jgi:hypothetical protein
MMQETALFEQIFSDAHLVDIDLAAWDKRIALFVLADHAGRTASGHRPLFVVEFARVRSLDIAFNHLDQEPPIELEADKHIQWRIDDFRVEPVEQGLRITLWQHSASPRMIIVCEGVNIREVPLDVPNQLFPGWARPYAGLIRPGLEELARGTEDA